MSRRGRDAGPTVTDRTCLPGARVRVTGVNGLMAGCSGTIIDGGKVQFDSGQLVSIPPWRLQLLQPAPPKDGANPAPAPRTTKFVRAERAKITFEQADGTKKTIEHVDYKPEDPLVETSEDSKPPLSRPDAEWNF